MLSLFSGCGGLDVGLHQAGFTPVGCCEKDANAMATLQYWLQRNSIGCSTWSDVTAEPPSATRRRLGIRRGELDLLAGGPPCQSFSLMGKRGSLEDARGQLLFEMVNFAKEFEPKAVLIEQVKGLLSAPGLRGDRGGVLKDLTLELEQLGYQVTYKVLNAANYGVPQIRKRLFIIAMANTRFQFPNLTHCHTVSNPSISPLLPYLTVQDAIADLPAPTRKDERELVPNHVDVTPDRDHERISQVPEGDYLARQLHLPVELRQRLNPKKDTTKFRRLAWKEPSLTLRCGEVFYHPTESRYLTPRESARLHGFDDDHILIGPIRGRTGSVKSLDQHRLVANAVPPTLARVLGAAIRIQLNL